uniref:ATP synthase complex subunit 8 n=1 Tax=Scriptaphyosemion cauveti TaxID=1289024 RepID=A0A518LY84_9TELE|nr:ATP synthase F0 subunit 8 [Scriptaphyosemion cauveti]QDW10570.1 ATP synthase F0 subunit 8 [Scriptaphyosemion cauveti]
MPQLDPAPWFYILVISWLVFITIIPPKVLAHHVHNDPNTQDTKTPTMDPWNWPW